MNKPLTIHQLYETVSFYRDIIEDEAALYEYVMKEDVKEAIKSVHPYAIERKPDGRYRTRVKPVIPNGKSDKRITLTSPTEEGLYIKLIEWYGLDNPIRKMTLDDLYNEWMQYRRNTKEYMNTVTRNAQHYNRYLKGTKFFKETITIKRADLKVYCCAIIRGETTTHRGNGRYEEGEHLTKKEWNNVKSILNGMFDYAVEREYIPVNLLISMKFDDSLFKAVKKKKKENQIFNTEEEENLIEWCVEHYKEDKESRWLLPVLTLYTGTRVGETVALKWDDYDGRYLTICRQEHLERESRENTVVDRTKTGTDRVLPLLPEAKRVLDELKAHRESEWIFQTEGKRLTERQADYIMEKYARKTGNLMKSSHKLRKTCGSNLFKKYHFTRKQCADYLGNSVGVFEDDYLYDTDTLEELEYKLNRVDKAC